MKPFTGHYKLLSPCLALAFLCACGTFPASEQSADRTHPELIVDPEAQRQYQRALLLLNAERFEEAENLLAEITRTYPNLAGPHVNLGILYSRTERTVEAQEALRNALERNPNNAVALTQLGVLYRHAGEFEQARRAYQSALEANPDHANAHLNLGILFDLYLLQPVNAIEHYERYQALARTPGRSVAKWIADLRRKVPAEQLNAAVEKP